MINFDYMVIGASLCLLLFICRQEFKRPNRRLLILRLAAASLRRKHLGRGIRVINKP